MRWFDGWFGEKKTKGGRQKGSKNRTGDEKLKAEQARFLAWVRKHNPALWQKIMSQTMGMAEEDKLEQFEKMAQRFKRMGYFKDPNDTDDKGWLKEALTGLPIVLEALRPQPTRVEVVTSPPPAQLSAPAPAETARESQPQVQQEYPMTLVSIGLIKTLNGKTPKQAAEWLVAQELPLAQELVKDICQTPDEQMLALLHNYATRYPDVAGLVAWLRQRPDWLMQTVRGVRDLCAHAEGGEKKQNLGI